MAKNDETTTRFRVDISELKSAMQEAKRQVSVANSEFKAASASMDDWTKSSEGLQAKLDQLESNLKSQNKILDNLEEQYKLTVQEMGEGSAAADRLKVAINNQKAVIAKTEKEIDEYGETLKEVQEAEKVSAKTGKKVADVLDEMGDKADDTENGFTVLKGAIATFAGNVLTGLADALKDAVGNLLNLAEETREFRTEMSKLETAFTSAGHSTDAATTAYKDLYAVLGDEGQAVEAANFLAKLCSTEEELANWTTIATGVYGTFGASLPIESLTEAANETAKTGSLTGALADALNWAGVSEDDFQASLDGCTSEQERQALITETLNGLYSDAAAKYEETSGSIMEANRANADYTATLAEFGEKVEPITTKVKEGFNQVLQKILELVGGVDLTEFTAKIEEGFAVLCDKVIPAIRDGFQWILDNKDLVISGLTGIAAAFIAFQVASLINDAVNSFKAFKAAQEGATVAQWLMNAAMNANPIMLIISLVTGLIAALISFLATNDEARAKLVSCWNAIKEFVGGACKAIGQFFTETLPNAIKKMLEWFKNLPQNISTYLKNALNKVKEWASNMWAKAKETGTNFLQNIVSFFKQLPVKIGEFLLNVIKTIVSWRLQMIQKAVEIGTKFVSNIINAVKSLPSKMLEIGKNVVTGIWNGINNKFEWIKKKISSFVGDVTNWFKSKLGIHSPSKVMEQEVGKNIALGIAKGIEKYTAEVKTAAAKSAYSAIQSAGKQAESTGDTVLKKVKTYIEKLEKLQDDYAKNVKKVHTDLASDIEKLTDDFEKNVESLWKSYDDAVANRANSLAGGFGGIFDAFASETENTTETLLDNMKSQLVGLTQWSSTINKLSKRIESEAFMEELRNMGVDAAADIALLNQMTDAELQQFVEMWELKMAACNQIATAEMSDMKDETALAVDELTAEFDIKLMELKDAAAEDLKELKATFKTNLSELVADSKTELAELAEKFNDIGKNAGSALADGIKSQADQVKAAAAALAQAAKEAANMELDIHSPSRVFRNMGGFVGDGFILGINDSLKGVTASVANMAQKVTAAAASAVGGLAVGSSGGVTSGSVAASGGRTIQFNQTINSPKQLDKLTIYRQTKNLLGYVGGTV